MNLKPHTLLLILLLSFFSIIYPDVSGGKVNISSSPENAEIILDGISTGKYTPTTLLINDTLIHELEIQHPQHLFSKREFKSIPDSTIHLSVNLMALSDTTIIIGDLELGILSLTLPPLKIPYTVDNKKVYSKDAILNAGLHQVEWNGGEIYSSLDTILTIAPGKMTVLRFYPKRLSGMLTVDVIPEDAGIFLNKIQYGIGKVNASVNTGSYNLSIKRNGFVPFDTVITIKPDLPLNFDVIMDRIPDEDSDGFLDSIDLCPEVYGLYDGCPKQKKGSALHKYVSMLGKNLKSQNFSFSVGILSWQSRTPLNKKEASFYSYFNDGLSAFNNYRGISLLNSLSLSTRGFFVDLEYSQYRQGIRYEKEQNAGNGPVLFKKSEKDSNSYCLYYDSLAGLSPSVYFPSIALSAGINFRMQNFDLSIHFGYQWEHILYNDMIFYNDYLKYMNKESDYISNSNGEYIGPVHSWEVNSDWIFTGLKLSYNVIRNKRNSLLLYGKFRISVYDYTDIQWSAFEAGVAYRFTPAIKQKVGISTKQED